MDQYIHWDQVGFMKNRQLRDNIRRLIHIINYVNEAKIPVLVYFSDAEKAFDGVHWGIVKEVLSRMGLGPFLCIGLI